MKILVTGGTDFLGARLIPHLASSGHDVFALTRSEASQEKLRASGAIPVVGDLDRRDGLNLPAIDAVVHAAAHFRFSGPRRPFFRTNVTGTKTLLAAAQAAGSRTFVYISAAGIIMDDRGAPIRDADETAAIRPNSFSAYLASKAQGEAAVLAASTPGFRTIALRPPAIWGPGDVFSREIPQAVRSGRFAFIDRGDYPVATCHVDNVIEAIDCALARGTGGRAYFINDRERTSFRDHIAGIAATQGLSIDKIRSMPYALLFEIGRVMEFLAALTFSKTDPPLTRSLVRMIGREFTTSDAAARRDLGYVGRTTRAEGLRLYGP